MTKSKINQLATYFDNNPKATIRKGAKKFKISTTHTHRLLKTKTNIRLSSKEQFGYSVNKIHTKKIAFKIS